MVSLAFPVRKYHSEKDIIKKCVVTQNNNHSASSLVLIIQKKSLNLLFSHLQKLYFAYLHKFWQINLNYIVWDPHKSPAVCLSYREYNLFKLFV
jgi:hypothetical protein